MTYLNSAASFALAKSLRAHFENKTVVYADAEYINKALGLERRPQKGEWKEVVQIGAVKIDHKTGEIVGRFNKLVLPTIHMNEMTEDQWEHFTKLTGLTKKRVVEEGRDFKKTFSRFMKFCGDSLVVVMQGDEEVYKLNFKELKAKAPPMNFIRLKPFLVAIDKAKYSPLFSSDLYKLVGAKIDKGQAHDAEFDATSMAMFVDRSMNPHRQYTADSDVKMSKHERATTILIEFPFTLSDVLMTDLREVVLDAIKRRLDIWAEESSTTSTSWTPMADTGSDISGSFASALSTSPASTDMTTTPRRRGKYRLSGHVPKCAEYRTHKRLESSRKSLGAPLRLDPPPLPDMDIHAGADWAPSYGPTGGVYIPGVHYLPKGRMEKPPYPYYL